MPVSLASENPVCEANSWAPQCSLPEITQGCFETGSEREHSFFLGKIDIGMLKRGAAFSFLFLQYKRGSFLLGFARVLYL